MFALLWLFVGLSVHGVAQASAAELSRLAPAAATSDRSSVSHSSSDEPAQWRAVLNDAPPCEDPALEPEADADPAAPEASSVIHSVFGCTAAATSAGPTLRASSEIYRARFASSSVLARAPPRG